MSSPPSRLRNILGHLLSGSNHEPQQPSQDVYSHNHHIHQLSPTFFLERAAAIEPDAEAIYHVTVNNKILRRSYREFADRARGLAYYLIKQGYKRVGVLAPNTPAFLESIYGVAAGGAVIVPVNYRLKQEDIAYIFDFAEVDSIIADAEYVHLLDGYRKSHADTPIIVDNVGYLSEDIGGVSADGYGRMRMPQRDSCAAPLMKPCWRA
jgi:acyl-CoA synthetase (AMP-forming)/AMP-acid ligase II